MITKVLLFRNAVSFVHSKLKLFSFVPSVLDTVMCFTNIIGARMIKSQPNFTIS